MRTTIQSSAILFALGGISTTTAQWVDNSSLGSCADVDCPGENSTIQSQCTVTNHTYLSIGIDSFSSSISPSGPLTWTVAAENFGSIDSIDKSHRTIGKDFYLGTPPSLNLSDPQSGFGGCAVFMYGGKKYPPDTTTGTYWTCEDAIGSECQSSLVDMSKSFISEQQQNRTGNSSVADVCQRLERYLKDGADIQTCASALNGQDSLEFHAVALTGPSAPQAPSSAENATSNCQPVIPKSNILTPVYGYNDTGTYYFNDTLRQLNMINVALTVFFGQNGTSSVLEEPESHVSCLWPNALSKQSMQTMVEGKAGRVGVWGWAVSVSLVAGMMVGLL